jgi:hypothetical protein
VQHLVNLFCLFIFAFVFVLAVLGFALAMRLSHTPNPHLVDLLRG